MKVTVKWQEGVYFCGEARGHKLPIEGPPEKGGQDRGMRPMEAMLVSLGSCSSYDVVSILQKKRQPITSCEVEVNAERSTDIPAVFTKIHLTFHINGAKDALDAKAVEKAVALSVDKYCSVAKMLTDGGVQISHSYTLEG